jgi:hypothetical protein
MPRIRPLLALVAFALVPAAIAWADDPPPTVVTDPDPTAPPRAPAPQGDGIPDVDVEVPPPISDDEVGETIVVISDPFSRWDGTRWFIKTEVGLALPLPFVSKDGYEFWADAIQIRTILACDKDWQQGKKHMQVHCTIEDFGLQASDASDRDTKAEIHHAEKRGDKREAAGLSRVPEDKQTHRDKAQAYLEEVDKKLTGASVQLQVDDNGRVTAIDLEGLEEDNDREQDIADTLTLIMARVAVGFDMKLQKWHTLEEGFWTETTSKLMGMPIKGGVSMGTSLLIHRLSKIEGHLVVESRGKGVISYRDGENTQADNDWLTSFAGVSVYSEDDGYMTERVWVLKGTPTAGAWIDQPYWHAGRIVQLQADQKPDVGKTQLVTLPCCTQEGVAPWEPLEE